MEDSLLPENNTSQLNSRFLKSKFIIVFLFLFGAVFFGYFLFLSPPSNFTSGTLIHVDQGNSLRTVSFKLKDANVIRSRTAFEVFVILFGGEKHIISADYLFEYKMSVWQVSRRIVRSEFHILQNKVTIPEGFSNSEIAEIFDDKLKFFNKEKFLLNARDKEGSLFPDTYYFFSADDEVNVIKSMSENFEKKINPIRPKILASGKTEKQILTMASILEKEASGDADREIISGILWKRISLNMPLQVDAAPETYKTKGLPDNPIGNPGLEAINSAIFPQASAYLYYLHDKEGFTHYAKSFAEHKKNIAKYLK